MFDTRPALAYDESQRVCSTRKQAPRAVIPPAGAPLRALVCGGQEVIIAMQANVTIEAKVLGRKKPLFDDWAIPLAALAPGQGASLSLRDLIARIVVEEVVAFRQQQQERRLARVLTSGEIAQGLAAGKVDTGGHEARQTVDPQAAVATALQAFEDRLYLVFVDGQQQMSLDAAIALAPGSRVSFVRLVALAGG